MFKNQDTSVAKAKKGITDCNKAMGRADQLTHHNNQAMYAEKG